MLNKDCLITWVLDEVLRPSYSNNMGSTFLGLFVKNIVRLNIPEIELDWADLRASYNSAERSSHIRIFTEHNFISLRFSFKNLVKDWRVRHYIGENVPHYIGESESLSENEMSDETSVTFSDIKSWLSQCINISETIEDYLQLNELLSLMEQSASHPFVKNLLINIDDFFSCILDKVLISMLRAVLWLGKRKFEKESLRKEE